MTAQTVTGGCHCGAVRFEAVGVDTDKAIACNCSRCGRTGTMLCFVPATDFHLVKGEDSLTEYRFNKNVIQHVFCKVCGVQPFAQANGPDGTPMVAINIRCLDGVNVHDFKPTPYDGLSA